STVSTTTHDIDRFETPSLRPRRRDRDYTEKKIGTTPNPKGCFGLKKRFRT
ncbi:unnamed protein product, partial [Rotaria sp. Silwood2]